MLPLQAHTNKLTEHTQWNELATLIRLSYVVGSQSDQAGITYLYVPEILHLVCLTAGEGPSLVRKSAYGTVVNLLQSLYIARQDDSTEPGIMQLINECSLPETLKLFGLKRETPTGEYFNFDSSNERTQLDLGEQLIQFLIRIVDVSAGTRGESLRKHILVNKLTFQSKRSHKRMESSLDEFGYLDRISTDTCYSNSILCRPFSSRYCRG